MPVNKIKRGVLQKQIDGRRKKEGRTVQLQTWDAVKTVGLLYVLRDEEAYRKVLEIIQMLKSEGKSVFSLGLYLCKEIPHYCQTGVNFEYFNKKDMNWYGKPKGNKVSRFILNPFDVLINLDNTGNQAFEYILATARASIRAGVYQADHFNLYDLMIKPEGESEKLEIVAHIVDWIKKLSPPN